MLLTKLVYRCSESHDTIKANSHRNLIVLCWVVVAFVQIGVVAIKKLSPRQVDHIANSPSYLSSKIQD
jgi:hypothetical protein